MELKIRGHGSRDGSNLDGSILIFWGICLVYVGMIWTIPIISTNDGPVHMAMIAILRAYPDADNVVQRHFFKLNIALQPNWGAYAAGLLLAKVFALNTVEKIIQTAALITLPVSGFFALSRISPANRWLSIFLLPITLNQMFFWGLYNFCISVGLFFAVLVAFLKLRERRTLVGALLLGLLLCILFFCHAMGYAVAVATIVIISAVDCLDGLEAQTWKSTLYRSVLARFWAVPCVLPSAILFLIYLLRHSGSSSEYGPGIVTRLKYLGTFHILAINHLLIDSALGFILMGALVLLPALGLWAYFTQPSREGESISSKQKDVVQFTTLTVFFFVLALIIPDSFGGGWTHFQRAAVFPPLGCLMLAACFAYSRVTRQLFTGVASACALGLIASAAVTQYATSPQMMEFLAGAEHIAPHSTVLPIIFEKKPRAADGSLMQVRFNPFFQAANRFEFSGDRVSLFNYLARLSVYPVQYREHLDPQRLIFHWAPEQVDTNIYVADVGGFEQTTGATIDHILIWGSPAGAQLPLWYSVAEVLKRNYSLIYRSPSGRMSIFRRIRASSGSDGVLTLTHLVGPN